ncbi:MAG: hypothetical protein IKO40_11830 [Kiritimatiellae bacterium]|nr:hypothetical protein [Kiritimatiellia bacterium]
MAYDPTLKEEEIKNKVAADLFPSYDCTRILGNIDFCVQPKYLGPTLWETESLLWAEAKNGIHKDVAPLFAQLILTIGGEKTFDRHSPPPFLGAFDSEKIAFLPWHTVLDLFFRSDIDFSAKPSDWTTPAFAHVLGLVQPVVDTNLVLFQFGDPDVAKFLKKNLVVGATGTSQLQVTRNNFPFVYQKWIKVVKPSIAINWALAQRQGIHDADFFLADLLSKNNATLMQKLFVVLRGNHYLADRQLDPSGILNEKRVDFSDNQKAHTTFWNQYRRPPRRAFWDFINERRDLLMPPDIRERQGSFFTPQIWVEKAQEAIASVLGEDWQDEYDVWDPAGGTGNLLAGLDPKAKHHVWLSTLQQADVDIVRERIRNGAALFDNHVFQFDFLNDSFDKLPDGLRDIVNDPNKRRKLVVFMNPPYAEAGSTKSKKAKVGVSNETAVSDRSSATLAAFAKRELFAQFLARVYADIPGCVIAEFSKLKHLNGPYFRPFREGFLARLCTGFVVPAESFDNVKGSFPIGFMVWDTTAKERFRRCVFEVYDASGNRLPDKEILSYDGVPLLNDWMRPTWKNPKESEILGWMVCNGNDFQHQNEIVILSKRSNETSTFFKPVTRTNAIASCIYFATRHCIAADWLNDRDQFLWPQDSWKTDYEFQMDCVIYTLFHGQNRISCKAGVNRWIPFTEDEVGCTSAFASHFMSDWLHGKKGGANGSSTGTDATEHIPPDDGFLFAADGPQVPYNAPINALSPEASAVFDAGRELWRYYHAQPNAIPDASFWDVRAHFQGFKPNGHMNSDSSEAGYSGRIAALRAAVKALAARIRPNVYRHGFLC